MKDAIRKILISGLVIIGLSAIISLEEASAAEIIVAKADAKDVVVLVKGKLDYDTAPELRVVLFDHSLRFSKAQISILLSSPGGAVSAGVDMAKIIRSYKANTYVPPATKCYSACTIAFLGGVLRQNVGSLGYHNAWYEPTMPTYNVHDMVDEFITGQAYSLGLVNQLVRYVDDVKLRKFIMFYTSIQNQSSRSRNQIIELPNKYCAEVGVCKT